MESANLPTVKLNPVVFTDLDGTLLDINTYSYLKALPAVKYLQSKGIPIIFCSSKTREEQEVYRRELNINDPFVVENGGAILIPHCYFSFDFEFTKSENKYQIIELGIHYHEIRRVLEKLRAEIGIDFRGFGDMSTEEIAEKTGLNLEAAKRAKAREYSDSLSIEGAQQDIDYILGAIIQAGLNYAAGARYYSVMGPNDKGKAVKILSSFFRKKLGHAKTIALGESSNDVSMLSEVDIPVLVQMPGGLWQEIDLPNLYRVEGVGPLGWTRAIDEIFRVECFDPL